MIKPEFCVGIDLGTTHCAMASTGIGDAGADLTEFKIPQLVAPGQVQARTLLPSFLYIPHESETAAGSMALPWGSAQSSIVGEHARATGAKTPLRLVSSAKSWLCHAGVDRRAPLLPLSAGQNPSESAIEKLSPLEASIRYLSHLRCAWDDAHPSAQLADQCLTITVPASFDPVARDLTMEAANAAGLGNAVLLEEPQAAMYSWLGQAGDAFRNLVQVGDVVLVVDVGGGTSDFSLIAVEEHNGDLQLRRVAVGDHILLGGDNMDLALAYHLKSKLEQEGRKLDAAQLASLTHAVRPAKERLLSQLDASSAPVVIPGKGSKLIGGSIRTELSRDDLQAVLLEGFFPKVESSATPATRAHAGLRQLGLPYAQDAAITRHLAAFLSRQADSLATSQTGVTAATYPTAVLFNGGVFKSTLLTKRVRDQLDHFADSEGREPIRELSGANLDLSVSRGAAYFGGVKQGAGIRIRGGTAMAYYVGIESAMPAVPGMPAPLSALCLAPFGLEEGSHANMPEAEFALTVGQPVRFQFFGSSVRRDDLAGTLVDEVCPDELTPLQDIEITLDASDDPCTGSHGYITVGLQAGVTDVGTLQLFAIAKNGQQRWRIELNTRTTA